MPDALALPFPSTIAWAALMALVLDAAMGWPAGLYRRIGHPVGGVARYLAAMERRWNDATRPECHKRIAGVITIVALVGGVAVAAWAAQSALLIYAGASAPLWLAVLAWPGLAQRSLHDHVRAVLHPLESNDLPAARRAVGMIVGRDTDALDEAGVSRAAIESLAESFCDGICAPLFWFLTLGLPGLWAYKAINTADSMIGHYELRWRAFGWAAARSDDALNLVPARLSALLICLCAGKGWRILWRDHGRHSSPNAGWPEAAMAGALSIRLAGPIAYEGMPSDKPWIGDDGPAAQASDLRRALRLYRRCCIGMWAIVGSIAWVL
jgi:adenosylcobinamide-phosphate synthase